MRFLHLIRPVMCVLPEVASPDRKVSMQHNRSRRLLEEMDFTRGDQSVDIIDSASLFSLECSGVESSQVELTL